MADTRDHRQALRRRTPSQPSTAGHLETLQPSSEVKWEMAAVETQHWPGHGERNQELGLGSDNREAGGSPGSAGWPSSVAPDNLPGYMVKSGGPRENWLNLKGVTLWGLHPTTTHTFKHWASCQRQCPAPLPGSPALPSWAATRIPGLQSHSSLPRILHASFLSLSELASHPLSKLYPSFIIQLSHLPQILELLRTTSTYNELFASELQEELHVVTTTTGIISERNLDIVTTIMCQL